MTVTPSPEARPGTGGSGAVPGADGGDGPAVPPSPRAGARGGTRAGVRDGKRTDAHAGACAGAPAGTRAGERSAPARPPGSGQAPPSRGFLARAALITASLTVAGALLGLVRDQSLARLFGAGRDTDAFLVAWTLPEFAATLLIEDGLAYALVPAFSVALARRAQGAPGDPVRSLVAGTLPRLAPAFAAVGVLLAVAAPWLVGVLAPGLPDPALAVDCTRLTASCVLSFGLAGYCSAALRAHRSFLAPAAIYVAYNTGIVATMFTLGGRWGVRSAAFGVAVGGCLMVAVQLPSLVGRLRTRRPSGTATGTSAGADAVAGARPVDAALMATVLLFALVRQSQVLVERYLASGLPAGAISHLNYAQKVAQIPMTLSTMLCTVTFPVVARALADGDTEHARDRVERDLVVASWLVLLGTAAVVACAPQVVQLLFQRGAFTAHDTAATAGVMRVYALGLLGQTLTGVLVRSYFSAGRAAWYPVAAMAAGLAVTFWAGAGTVGSWGVTGIAAANAAGITVTAALLLAGSASGPRGRSVLPGGPRGVPVRARRVLAGVGGPLVAAVVAAGAGALAAGRAGGPYAGPAAGGATVTAVFVLLGRVLSARGGTFGPPSLPLARVVPFLPSLRRSFVRRLLLPVRSLVRRLVHAVRR
ncbi:murein biosynthesis integral membrane protein MurJ [Streptomyces collinus]|uniref:murein biosynthesis integral membrane protein MurJ n=1 Tax=Streptomyces collinus TaxID=42684 RepID=UPI002942A7A9|nr:lipid II flippase MurJ [Streptomyces collinus]